MPPFSSWLSPRTTIEEYNLRVVKYNGCGYVQGSDFGVWYDALLGLETACCDVGFVPPEGDVYRKVLAASRDLKFEMQAAQYERDMRVEGGALPRTDMPALVALLVDKQRKLNRMKPKSQGKDPVNPKVLATRVQLPSDTSPRVRTIIPKDFPPGYCYGFACGSCRFPNCR